MRNQNLWKKKKRVLCCVITTAMMLMLTACGNNANATAAESTQTSSSSEVQSVNSTEESEIETISTDETQKDFVMGQITEITEEIITVKLAQKSQPADEKLKSGDVELSDRPEREAPSRESGGQPEGEVPSGESGSKPEGEAPSGEFGSKPEGEAPSGESGSKPEGEVPSVGPESLTEGALSGELGAGEGPVGGIEDGGKDRLQKELEYTGETLAVSLSDEVKIVINGTTGSASELNIGDTVTLVKDGDTITSIIVGTQDSIS